MLMNTVLRSFFLDPIEQAHIGHRQGQVRRMMNDARLSRDPILQEKATVLQQQMMPEQLKIQNGCYETNDVHHDYHYSSFSWLTTTVETFRVDYVSLPSGNQNGICCQINSYSFQHGFVLIFA